MFSKDLLTLFFWRVTGVKFSYKDANYSPQLCYKDADYSPQLGYKDADYSPHASVINCWVYTHLIQRWLTCLTASLTNIGGSAALRRLAKQLTHQTTLRDTLSDISTIIIFEEGQGMHLDDTFWDEYSHFFLLLVHYAPQSCFSF